MTSSELNEVQRKRIEHALETVPFARLLGIQLESVELGLSVMSLEIRDELKQNNAVVHGGAIASLIDTTTAFAVIPLLDANETTTTVDLTISYLRPLTNGVVKCTARVLRAGGRIIFVSAEVLDETGNLATTALTTYLRLARS